MGLSIPGSVLVLVSFLVFLVLGGKRMFKSSKLTFSLASFVILVALALGTRRTGGCWH